MHFTPRALSVLFALSGFACSSSAPTSAPTPAMTSAAESRDVTFQSGDLTLVGTLTLPERTAGAPVPALVLIAGSGPFDRNEVMSGQLAMSFGFGIPTFRLIAEGLRDSGVAVLRYDKRSCGRFNACADNDYPVLSDTVTVQTFVQDAEAGLDYLEALPEIDPARISVVGHSEGGSYVVPILTARAELRSGIMLSAPYQPIDATVHDQLAFVRNLLAQAKTPQAQVNQLLAPLIEIDSALTMIRSGNQSGDAVQGAFPPFLQSLMALGDANPSLSHDLNQPILALGGSYDWNVPVSELDAWHANFAASVQPENRETRVLDCMTHALNCISQPDYTKLQPSDIGTTIHRELVPALAGFVLMH